MNNISQIYLDVVEICQKENISIKEFASLERAEIERYDREQSRQNLIEQKDIESNHQHHIDMITHDLRQYENHEAFNVGNAYIGSDGEYHLFREMKWSQ